jgi:hypothetical protein
MIKDTCLGCSAAAGPLLQRFALGVLKNCVLLVAFTSSSSTYNKNATKINTVHNMILLVSRKGLTGGGNCWVFWGTKTGKEGGGTHFIPRERGVVGFRV